MIRVRSVGAAAFSGRGSDSTVRNREDEVAAQQGAVRHVPSIRVPDWVIGVDGERIVFV